MLLSGHIKLTGCIWRFKSVSSHHFFSGQIWPLQMGRVRSCSVPLVLQVPSRCKNSHSCIWYSAQIEHSQRETPYSWCETCTQQKKKKPEGNKKVASGMHHFRCKRTHKSVFSELIKVTAPPVNAKPVVQRGNTKAQSSGVRRATSGVNTPIKASSGMKCATSGVNTPIKVSSVS